MNQYGGGQSGVLPDPRILFSVFLFFIIYFLAIAVISLIIQGIMKIRDIVMAKIAKHPVLSHGAWKVLVNLVFYALSAFFLFICLKVFYNIITYVVFEALVRF